MASEPLLLPAGIERGVVSELDPIDTVQAWHDALNREDPEAVLRLSDPNVEILGPRGSGFGHDLLRQWLHHARVQLLPKRIFARADTVVVEQRGTWKSPETGETIGEAEVVSVFRVRNRRVTSYARFDHLAAALEHAGLTDAELVSQ